MKKSISLMIAVFLLAGLVSACSKSNNDSNTSPSASSSASASPSPSGSPTDEEVELTWWVEAREDLQAIYEEIKVGFETAYPNVKINMVKTPDDKINERMSIAINTNELPDVQQGGYFWPLTYASKGLLLPLDDIIDKEDFAPKSLEAMSVDGKVYMFPNSITAGALLVNRDLFKAKNAENLLPAAGATWSYDQFLEAAKAVNDPAGNVYGFGTYSGDQGGDQGHHMFLWGFGAKTFSDDNKSVVLNSPEGVEGLDFLVKMIDAGVVPPGAAGLKAGQVINEMFLQGKIGMTFGSLGNAAAFNKAFDEGSAKKFEYDLVPYPSKDGTTSNTVFFGYGTWAWNTKDETRMKWAKELVKFVNNKENSEKMAKAPSVLPVRNSLSSAYDPNTLQGKTINLFQYAGNIGAAIPGYAETRTAFFPELQAAFTKKKTAKEALDAYAAKANEIIANNSK